MQAQDYLKQGLAAGTALVVIEYVQKVQYYQNSMPYDHSTAIMLWSYLAILVLAGITYWAVVEARNEKGSLNFGQAFFVCIYVVFIASLMVGGFYYIYGKYIDPNEVERMVKYWGEKLKAEKMGDKLIKEKLDQLRMGYTASSQFLLGLKYIVYGLFISLIIAAFASRKRKIVQPQS